jgi:glyoxylase-like metal-dependent hydrolase (beta-lactamase superfamily II)
VFPNILFVPVRIGYALHFRTPIDDHNTQVFQYRFSPTKDGSAVAQPEDVPIEYVRTTDDTGEFHMENFASQDHMAWETQGPLADRSKFIKPGDQVASGITAVDAAGHSPGLLAFHVESAGKRVMITADTCTQYVMAVQRPEWHFEMDDDKEKAVATRRRILDMLAADKIFVASFHMPFPGIGYIDKGQGGYRWVPHSYQLNL